MRRLALLLIIVVLWPAIAFGEVLIGLYKVKGTNPDGSPYRGQVEITVQGDIYVFRWHISNGESYDGRGRLEGNTLIVDWGDATPVIYKVEPGGTLRGTWSGGAGTETLTPEASTVALNKALEDCDFETKDAGRLIKGCSEIVDRQPRPAGQKSDEYVATAYLLRSEGWRIRGEFDRELADIERAIEFNPNDSLAYFLRAATHFDELDFERAIKDYDRAIALNPEYTEAHNNRGLAYENMGDYDRALEDYNRAIALDPNYALAYLNRGNFYYEDEDDGQAIRDYDRAIALNPGYVEAHYNRGNIHYSEGDYEQAIRDYDRAIALNPKHSSAYSSRGLAYEQRGDKIKAAADYRKALELQPADKVATEGLARLKL